MGPSMPGRISWAQIRQWSAYYGYNEDETDFLDACILAMDGEFMQYHAELVRKAQEK